MLQNCVVEVQGKKLQKKKKTSHILSKFSILCWNAFTAVLDHMWSLGHGLDMSVRALAAPAHFSFPRQHRAHCQSPRKRRNHIPLFRGLPKGTEELLSPELQKAG